MELGQRKFDGQRLARMDIEYSKGQSDIFSKARRSQIMSRVRGKNTQPEMAVRSILHAAGFRYRLHRRDLPGNPDIAILKHKIVIFVHGCFWHQHQNCKKQTIPKQNHAFWEKKLAQNVIRDAAAYRELEKLGWKAVIIWECEIKKRPDGIIEKIQRAILANDHSAQIGHPSSNFEEGATPI
jgi:DNA mismatch endonuclease (patch repair protein)